MSSGMDEDEYRGARVPSPTVTFVSRRRRTRGQRRVWTPLPQYPGLNQMANPIPYTPQVNFPPPPIMNPIPMVVPPPPYPLPPPPIPAPLAPAPPAAQAVALVAHCGWHHHATTHSCGGPGASGSSPGDSGMRTT